MCNFLAQDMIDTLSLCTVPIYSAHAQCPHLEHYVFARLTCCIYGLRKEGGVALYVQDKAVGTEGAGAGGAIASPDFGRSVNPIPTRGWVILCPPHYYSPPRIFRPSFGPARDRLNRGATCIVNLIMMV